MENFLLWGQAHVTFVIYLIIFHRKQKHIQTQEYVPCLSMCMIGGNFMGLTMGYCSIRLQYCLVHPVEEQMV